MLNQRDTSQPFPNRDSLQIRHSLRHADSTYLFTRLFTHFRS